MDAQEHSATAETRAPIERRRSPRVEVLGLITGESGPDNTPVTVLNWSADGFLMQTSVGYPPGHTLEFRFTVGAADPIRLRARVARMMRATTAQGTSYICGLEFVDRDTPAGEAVLQSLFDLLSRPGNAA